MRVKKLYSIFEWALESFWAFFSSLILKDPWCPQVAAAHSSRSNHPSSGVITHLLFHLHKLFSSPFFLLFQLFMFSLCSWVLVWLFFIFQQLFLFFSVLVRCILISSTSNSVCLSFVPFCSVQFDYNWNFHMSLELVLVFGEFLT